MSLRRELILHWWKDLSVAKKLYAVVGLMAILVLSELFTLLFAMNTLSSVRAFVAGEGLWSKAQKDAIHSLYQYALHGDEKYYRNFKSYLTIPAGDHAARLEMASPAMRYAVVREGFLQGGNHPGDVDGMIQLLLRFHQISYLRDAIAAWTRADELLEKITTEAENIHRGIRAQGKRSARGEQALNRVAQLNLELTEQETLFSSTLGAGSRWLETVLMSVLALTVLTVEGTGIFLTFRFSRNLSHSLLELRNIAGEVGEGKLSVRAPVHSRDELGQVAEALNKMITALKSSVLERREAETGLQKLNESLERRVEERTGELHQRELELSLITNAVPVLLGHLDRRERFKFANAAFCNWFGVTKAQVIGKSLREILGETRYPPNQPHIAKVLSGEVVTYERQSTVGTVTLEFEITFLPEWDEAGAVAGFILVATDITKFKEIGAELKQAKENAEAANASKSRFLANMSHEIRTPLGAILGFSELLTSEEMSASQRLNSSLTIKRNGQLLSNIINDILDLSKVEAGKLDIESTTVCFNEIVADVESLLNLRATDKGLKLVVRSDGMIPRTVKTDPLRLRQILLNIVGNAIKFTHTGSVEVVIGLTAEMKLAFAVKDSGIGIRPDQADKIFAPFAQADPSTTRKFGGTGLGLVLSKKLAHALGGDVVLKESSSHGSTFVVTIDPGTPEAVHFENFEPRKVAGDPQPLQIPDLKQIKVLLVEDSIDNQTIVTHFLRHAGAKVEAANNGREGLEKALNGDYGLVLMDLQMPEMDGYEAVKELRRRGYHKPVVALSAHAMKEDRKRCLEIGFDDHLSKPVERISLLEAVARYS